MSSILLGDTILYPIQSKIISSLWGVVFHIRNIILLGLTTKKTLLMQKEHAAEDAQSDWFIYGLYWDHGE